MHMVQIGLLAALLAFSGCAGDAPGDPGSAQQAARSDESEKGAYTMTAQQSQEVPLSEAFILVPGGSFQRDEEATNISAVSPFYMGRYAVTREQFTAVTGLADPSGLSHSTGKDDPVQNVLWYHALVFCNRLSAQEGLTPVYAIGGNTDPDDWGPVPASGDQAWDEAVADWTADGYRLPTEMEWLWAAMGADSSAPGEVNTTGYQKRFAGDSAAAHMGDYVWYEPNANQTTHPVGQKRPNELGLYDLTGNVWEWCWDRYGDWPQGALEDYTGPASGGERVLHGGSWHNPAYRCAMSFRLNHHPAFQWGNIGLRIVRSA